MKLFISYRRADSQYVSDRLYEALSKAFGRDSVFKDIDAIPLGADFRAVVVEAIAKCDVALIVIGARWLNATDNEGTRRLENANDLVRVEIESALTQNLTVIPLLAEHVSMPSSAELPNSLAPISYRNAGVIRPDPEFASDVARLVRSLQRISKLREGEMPQSNAGLPRGVRAGLRYFCYISRSKVVQLMSQLGPPSETVLERSQGEDSFEYLNYVQGLAYGSGQGWSDLDMSDAIQQLRYVLWHILNREKVGDLNAICRARASAPLDAFCYRYSGRFGRRGRRKAGLLGRLNQGSASSRGAGPPENETEERTSDGRIVRSGMAEITSTCGRFKLNLACSMKYFSDMGGSAGDKGEWWVAPHSGNWHFFEGDTEVWFDTLIFITGVRGKQIFGTPLFLVTGTDPNMRI